MICQHSDRPAVSAPYLGPLCQQCRELLSRPQLLEGCVTSVSLIELADLHARQEAEWVRRFEVKAREAVR